MNEKAKGFNPKVMALGAIAAQLAGMREIHAAEVLLAEAKSKQRTQQIEELQGLHDKIAEHAPDIDLAAPMPGAADFGFPGSGDAPSTVVSAPAAPAASEHDESDDIEAGKGFQTLHQQRQASQ